MEPARQALCQLNYIHSQSHPEISVLQQWTGAAPLGLDPKLGRARGWGKRAGTCAPNSGESVPLLNWSTERSVLPHILDQPGAGVRVESGSRRPAQRGRGGALCADQLPWTKEWTKEVRSVPSLEEDETHQHSGKNSNLCPRSTPALTEVEDRSECGGPSDHRLSIRRHPVSCNNPPQAWGLSRDQNPRRR